MKTTMFSWYFRGCLFASWKLPLLFFNQTHSYLNIFKLDATNTLVKGCVAVITIAPLGFITLLSCSHILSSGIILLNYTLSSSPRRSQTIQTSPRQFLLQVHPRKGSIWQETAYRRLYQIFLSLLPYIIRCIRCFVSYWISHSDTLSQVPWPYADRQDRVRSWILSQAISPPPS